MAELNEPVEELFDPRSPFHRNNAPGLNLVMLMRCADYLYVIASAADKNKADQVLAEHNKGKIVGPFPDFNLEEDDE